MRCPSCGKAIEGQYNPGQYQCGNCRSVLEVNPSYSPKLQFYYVAWLQKGGVEGKGTPVARGSRKEVKQKARDIFSSPSWQEFEGPVAKLTLTRGPRQLFVEATVLKKGEQANPAEGRTPLVTGKPYWD